MITTCLVEYKNIPHLNQIYVGFKKLEEMNIIKLKFNFDYHDKELISIPVIRVVINNKIVVYYDTLDGLNWIDEDQNENIDFFLKSIKCDYYFKRSYLKELNEKASFEVLPLGLNYGMYFNYSRSINDKIFQYLKSTKLAVKLFKISSYKFPSEYIEHIPYSDFNNQKILFSARLWNPETAKTEESKIQRKAINDFRIEIVKVLKNTYKDKFVGGIFKDNYSASILEEEYLLPFSFTNRVNYLKLMKSCSICIASAGIHDSIGWKFAEYIAASRAIISEPLKYDVPDSLIEHENYLEFTSIKELIDNINNLIYDKDKLTKMMEANHSYYHKNLKPELLILNTLKRTSHL